MEAHTNPPAQEPPELLYYTGHHAVVRRLEEKDVRESLDFDAVFKIYEFSSQHETHDLYFWGIKTGD